MDHEDPQPQYRWDPFLNEWVIFAPARGKRPFQGKSFTKEPKKTWTCPFCPDAPEGMGVWTVKQLPNKFAALSEFAPPFIEEQVNDYYKKAPNFGKCEVILYSQDHNASFGSLSLANIADLIDLWAVRYETIAAIEQIKYIFIMENRGKEVGNSMSHPHGQIYSFPFLSSKIERQFESYRRHFDEKGTCLMCELLKIEMEAKDRIIEENEHFIAEIPYYAHWAFEVHIIAKRHISSIDEMTPEERKSLAVIMRHMARRYDKLRGDGQLMPYVQVHMNAPVNTEDREKWHWKIEYYTPFRGKDKWKFLAGVELGTLTFIGDALPETNAAIMRNLDIKLD